MKAKRTRASRVETVGIPTAAARATRPSSIDKGRPPRVRTADCVRPNPGRIIFEHMLAITVGWLSLSMYECDAGSPETPPAYARSEQQRVDASLHAISFHGSQLGIAAGDHGTVLRTDNAGVTWQPQASTVTCRLDDVIWLNDRRCVAVGGAYDRITNVSRGVVILSDDGGVRWRRADDDELPRLRRIIKREDGVLNASGDWSDASLSNQYESRDGGIRWLATDATAVRQQRFGDLEIAGQLAWSRATHQHSPVRAVYQHDPQNIWAVGDHGVILHSRDGGQSWRASRGDQRRSAVLCVSARPDTIPWSILGQESLELRNRVSALVIDQIVGPGRDHRLAVARQVAATMGVAGVDRVSRADAVVAEIAGWIDLHRPAVLLMDKEIDDSLRDQITAAAATTEVDRIVEYAFAKSNGDRGDAMLHCAAMLTECGILAGDLHEDALHWIAPHQLPPSATLLRRRYDGGGANRVGESITAGISLGSPQQRATSGAAVSRRQLQIVQARLGESKRLDHLIDSTRSADEFPSAMQLLLDQTSHEDRFRFLWMALRRTASETANTNDHLLLHQSVLREIGDRYAATSVGKWAALRDQAMNHSLEWKRLRASQLQAIPVQAAMTNAAAEVVPVSPFQDRSEVTQASATVPLLVPNRTPVRFQPGGESHSGESSRVDLAWEFHPVVLLSREAARQRGDSDTLQTTGGNANLNRLATHHSDWTHLIETRNSKVLRADRARQPPRLDGKMDDPCWASATSTDVTDVRVAYDDQYVYVALHEPADRLSPDSGDATGGVTVRDHDLSSVDRVQLRLDIDRDLLTSLQLEFTDSGRTRDAIDGFVAWQPSWYVAAHREDDSVQFELAILRRDLTDLPIHPGESWFLSTRAIAAGQRTASQPMPDPGEWYRVVFR